MNIGYLMQAGVPDVRYADASGPAIHVRRTVDELRRLGHRVRVLLLLDGRLWRSDDFEELTPVHVPGLDDGPRRMAERAIRRVQHDLRLPYAAWFESRRFAAACRRELADCDVLYERMGWMGWGGSLAASWMQVPHVLEVNGDHPAEFEVLGIAPRGIQRAVGFRVTGYAARRAAHTVATGEGWRRRHIERWGVDPETVSVVHNGSAVVELLERRGLRCYRDVADDAVRVIYAGSLDEWQGLPILLRAVARAVERVRLTLTIAGAGPREHELKRMAASLRLGSRVAFAGHLRLDALAGRLGDSDVGVSLYRGRVEYNGLKLLDYKAAGLATVAAGCNGEPSLIGHERTGLIVAPDDEGAVAEAIVRLARDVGSRVDMGRRARQEAETQHRWRHTAEALEGLLGGVVRRAA
jgi:glycosyltransferase involved in cell wall biosynthesis